MRGQRAAAARRALVWIVDHDRELRAQLQVFLERSAFDVRVFPDGRDVERRLVRERPDLLVLERQLEGEDGLDLCRRIRAGGDDVPIIMLTARNSIDDRILGLDSGADDYLGKPVVPRELAARMQAVLRRRAALPAGAPVMGVPVLQFGDCYLDIGARILLRAGCKVELTSGEFALLAALAQHPHRSLTRERLLQLARGPGSATSERSIDVQVSRLRKLVESDPTRPRHIQTVWGYGYVFVPEDRASTA